ncbi:MAG: TonB family protein [Thiobacillaceae bacterium]
MPRFAIERAAGLMLVLVAHAAALWGLWQHRLIPSPPPAKTLFVNFIAPPALERKVELMPPTPKARSSTKPQPRQVVAAAPVVAPADHVAPAPQPAPTQPLPMQPTSPQPASPLPAPVNEAPTAPVAPPPAMPVGPVALGGELSVACPERTPPRYPSLSRRLGEEGTVVVHVELDEHGRVASARVVSSSGFVRLDEAALSAVKTWQCRPAERNGQPVRAVALQPFKFILQGS